MPQATKSAYVLLPVTCLRRKHGALEEMFGREQGMTMTQADSYFHASGYAQPPESVGYGAMFAGMQNQMEVSPLFQALDDSSQLFLFQSSTTLLLFQAPFDSWTHKQLKVMVTAMQTYCIYGHTSISCCSQVQAS